MSSLVQKICTISPTPDSAVPSPSTSAARASRRLRKYSIALTSWRVSASISASSVISAATKVATSSRR